MTTRPDDKPRRPLKVLVTGSVAPLAGELVDTLRVRGHQVHVLDLADSDDTRVLPPVHAARAPAADPNLLAQAVTDVDATVLLTGLGPLTAVVDDAAALDAILGHARPGSALIELSTLAVYGDHGPDPADETTEPTVPPGLEPVRAAEIRTLAADDWLRPVVLRAGLVYGPGGGPVVRAAIEHAHKHGVSRYFADRNDTYPLVHGHDLLELLVLLVEDDTARGIYHAVTTRHPSGVLAALIADAAGVDRIEPWGQDSLHTELGIDTLPPHINVRAVTTRTRQLGWLPTGPSLGAELREPSIP